jgi:hypothetical protein
MGVPPMVFESQPDKASFDKAYPDGIDTRFYFHSSFDKGTAAPTGNDAVVVDTLATTASSYGQLIMGFVIGLITAFFASCFFGKKNSGYERIGDGPNSGL